MAFGKGIKGLAMFGFDPCGVPIPVLRIGVQHHDEISNAITDNDTLSNGFNGQPRCKCRQRIGKSAMIFVNIIDQTINLVDRKAYLFGLNI